MEWLQEYAEHAKDCREAARRARTVAEQEHLFQMADNWEQLARRRAAYLHLESILAELLEDKGNRNSNAS
jgi:hypothetical protein